MQFDRQRPQPLRSVPADRALRSEEENEAEPAPPPVRCFEICRAGVRRQERDDIHLCEFLLRGQGRRQGGLARRLPKAKAHKKAKPAKKKENKSDMKKADMKKAEKKKL